MRGEVEVRTIKFMVRYILMMMLTTAVLIWAS